MDEVDAAVRPVLPLPLPFPLVMGTVLAMTRAGGRSDELRGREAAEKGVEGVVRWRKERGCTSACVKVSRGEAGAGETKAEMMWAWPGAVPGALVDARSDGAL